MFKGVLKLPFSGGLWQFFYVKTVMTFSIDNSNTILLSIVSKMGEKSRSYIYIFKLS